jgi:outer membrane biosynthesis protein TonB
LPKRKAKPKPKPKPKAKPQAKPQAKPFKKLEPLCGQCGARHPFGTDCDPAQLMSFARVQRNKALIDQAVESQQRILPTRSKRRTARRRS